MKAKSYTTKNTKTQLEIQGSQLRGKVTISKKAHLLQCIFFSLIGLIPMIVCHFPMRGLPQSILMGDLFSILFCFFWILPAIPFLVIAILGFFYPRGFRFDYNAKDGFSSNYFILNWLWKGKKMAILVALTANERGMRRTWDTQMFLICRDTKAKKFRLVFPIGFSTQPCESREHAKLQAREQCDFFKKSSMRMTAVISKHDITTSSS